VCLFVFEQLGAHKKTTAENRGGCSFLLVSGLCGEAVFLHELFLSTNQRAKTFGEQSCVEWLLKRFVNA
jgi:hypothetical protein